MVSICDASNAWVAQSDKSMPGFIRAVRPSRPPLDGYFLLSVWVEGTLHCYFQKWNITGVYIRENDHLDTTKTGYAMFEAMLAVAIPLMLRHNNINNMWQRLSWGTCGGFCGLKHHANEFVTCLPETDMTWLPNGVENFMNGCPADGQVKV